MRAGVCVFRSGESGAARRNLSELVDTESKPVRVPGVCVCVCDRVCVCVWACTRVAPPPSPLPLRPNSKPNRQLATTGSATLQQPNLHSFFYKSLIIHRFIHSAASFWMTHIHRYTHTHIGEERKTNREENAQTTISKKTKKSAVFLPLFGFFFFVHLRLPSVCAFFLSFFLSVSF